MANLNLGSLQYSILEPNAFAQANGAEWVLMDGRNIENSALGRLTGIKFLPDGRGVFIRGMNENRDKTTGDADGNRPIGAPQADQFANHNHPVSYTDQVYPFETGGMGIQANDGPQVQWTRLNLSIGNTGGNETRPRNIAVYLYVKIN